MEEFTRNLRKGNDLGSAEVAAVAAALLSDAVSDKEKAGFLRALADKGETPEEISSFVEAFLERAVDPGLDPAFLAGPVLDVCGTGGDKLNLFNISTATIFILAAAGVHVVKHGNRGITSKSGGADVLEALGVRIDLPPEDLARCVRVCGAGFLFAPLYHPAFKAVAAARRMLAEEGRRSVFNVLGPLLNPARPAYQLVGVFDPALVPVFARILALQGRRGAWVVHGSTGDGGPMDEVSTLGPTRVAKVAADGSIAEEVIDPRTLSLGEASLDELKGGDAPENAKILRGILEGKVRGARRDIVLLNAAAGLAVTGIADDLARGLEVAAEKIDSGEALRRLEMMREFK